MVAHVKVVAIYQPLFSTKSTPLTVVFPPIKTIAEMCIRDSTDEQLAQYVDSIISTQSTGVDIISGATTDCQAIVTAIVRAFAG